ncbi:DJ-1/PfpI family protein [Mycobacterium yunnanensis]|uniref:DJ-1/PfpI family protein n=1 Tax=Mycobacterium yunnanensis TaxID=368477 RepID=A0A9X2YNU5_9MYCO|nr:helix-turn-helix domain-containing protein [Mycobacterium yunnanensis]MCV7422758.1 DJ-1/PfpI family protein [Mycobacterium yunnanensis]
MHRVVTLALPQVVAFDLAIPAQIFGHYTERHLYDFSVCAERPGPVPSSTGFDITATVGLEALDDADTVIVPGFLPLDDPPDAVSTALRRAAARGARMASVCIGAFGLAAAGLLDGRTATTHWAHADELAARFPEVTVRPDVLFVDEGQVLTSAGIAAGIDLCLHMYRNDQGAEAAADVARRMVAAIHRPGGQAQFMPRPLPGGGSRMAETCAWAVARIDQPITVEHLAGHAGYAPRTFARHFREETGMPPLRWLTAQRVLEARRLLEATDLGVDEVARRSGLGTAANLRLHLAREASTTPSSYRNAFRRPANES